MNEVDTFRVRVQFSSGAPEEFEVRYIEATPRGNLMLTLTDGETLTCAQGYWLSFETHGLTDLL